MYQESGECVSVRNWPCRWHLPPKPQPSPARCPPAAVYSGRPGSCRGLWPLGPDFFLDPASPMPRTGAKKKRLTWLELGSRWTHQRRTQGSLRCKSSGLLTVFVWCLGITKEGDEEEVKTIKNKCAHDKFYKLNSTSITCDWSNTLKMHPCPSTTK